MAQRWPKSSQMADKKSSNKLYKQISAVVLAVFQGQYLRGITMQPIRQLQWTDIKATSEILIFSFLEKNKAQYRLNKKNLFSSCLQFLHGGKYF